MSDQLYYDSGYIDSGYYTLVADAGSALSAQATLSSTATIIPGSTGVTVTATGAWSANFNTVANVVSTRRISSSVSANFDVQATAVTLANDQVFVSGLQSSDAWTGLDLDTQNRAVMDSNDNTYVIMPRTSSTDTNQSVVIARFNQRGTVDYQKHIVTGSTTATQINAGGIIWDSGYLYLQYSFYEASTDTWDTMVLKYTDDMVTRVWAKKLTSYFFTNSTGGFTLNSGNLYLAGNVQTSGAGTISVDVYKMSATDGSKLWFRKLTYTTASPANAGSVSVRVMGSNVYVASYAYNTFNGYISVLLDSTGVLVNNTSGTATTYSFASKLYEMVMGSDGYIYTHSGDASTTYISKWNSSFTHQWTKTIAATNGYMGGAGGTSFKIDSSNNLYFSSEAMLGYTYASGTPNPAMPAPKLIKLDSSGNLIYAVKDVYASDMNIQGNWFVATDVVYNGSAQIIGFKVMHDFLDNPQLGVTAPITLGSTTLTLTRPVITQAADASSFVAFYPTAVNTTYTNSPHIIYKLGYADATVTATVITQATRIVRTGCIMGAQFNSTAQPLRIRKSAVTTSATFSTTVNNSRRRGMASVQTAMFNTVTAPVKRASAASAATAMFNTVTSIKRTRGITSIQTANVNLLAATRRTARATAIITAMTTEVSVINKVGRGFVHASVVTNMATTATSTRRATSAISTQATVSARAIITKAASTNLVAVFVTNTINSRTRGCTATITSSVQTHTAAVKTAQAQATFDAAITQHTVPGRIRPADADLVTQVSTDIQARINRLADIHMAMQTAMYIQGGISIEGHAHLHSEGFVLAIGRLIKFDPYLTMRIDAERRTLSAAQEHRYLVVTAETRQASVKSESRGLIVDQETRVNKIKGTIL